MSDAMTDMYRDAERDRHFDAYLKSVKEYLENPKTENLVKVLEAAENTDNVHGGYWGGTTNLRKYVEKLLAQLRANDKEAWTKFLSMLLANKHPIFQEFKAMSPFKDKLLILVDYGCGFVTMKSELQNMLDECISQGKNLKTYDADKYLVALPMPDLGKAEVKWLHCGYLGAKGPRKADEKR
ncbi:MAG: hypothetical protein AAB378_00540 [Patescibacteria group bacterium]